MNLPFLNVDPAMRDRIVPASGFTAQLTVVTAGVMAFLAVFALALSITAGRLAERWGSELGGASTVRIEASGDDVEAQVAAALTVLRTTPGIERAQALSADEERALLAPWFGTELPLEDLALPVLIEVVETRAGYDADALRLRLAGEAPSASLDDHSRWRKPLVKAADRLRFLSVTSLVLMSVATAAMITLGANAALAANSQVIKVLRLIGAKDSYIGRAFVRRFTVQSFAGAFIGAIVGLIAIALMPRAQTEAGFLTGLGFQGAQWLCPFVIPFIAASIGYIATRIAAHQTLKRLM